MLSKTHRRLQILKKNIQQEINKTGATKVLFFDEARFGTHTKIGYGWYPKGTRPRTTVKIGYENFYLYGCVDYQTGDHFSLLLPHVSTICMNLYLEHLSKQWPDERMAIIMDQAGWHCSKTLIIPPNIIPIYLPPYSPELNPIERLWLHIKKSVLNNKVYIDLKDLEKALCQFINSMDPLQVKQICSANYLVN